MQWNQMIMLVTKEIPLDLSISTGVKTHHN